MPFYATAYVLVLAALAVASWQVSERSGVWPAWIRNGDMIASATGIVLTIAYWSEGLRATLGLLAVPMFAASVAWQIFAIGPAVDLSEKMAVELDPNRRRGVMIFSIGVSLVLTAPALFCGWRVALAALDL